MLRWEYCVVDLDAERPAAYLLTLEGAQPLFGEGDDLLDKDSSALVAHLGEEGWELTTATTEITAESSLGFQPHLTQLRSNRLLYFKRPKNEP